MGDCGDDRFDPATCWDETNKEFAGSLPDNPPPGSRVYAYSASDNGKSAELCAMMETSYAQAGPFACPSLSAQNNAPVIQGVNVPYITAGSVFAGYIEAVDHDGDFLTWTLDTSLSSWNGWSAPPRLIDSGTSGQKIIRAESAGPPGEYPFAVTISDGTEQIRREFTILVGE